MGFLPIGLCVIGLIGLYMLGRSLGQLRPSREDIYQLAGYERINRILSGLLAGPPFALVVLAVLFMTIYRDDLMVRATHGVFVMGLWMVLALSFFMLVIISRLGYRPSLSTFTTPVLVVPIVAYLTPLLRFKETFDPPTLLLPLLVGLFIIVVCYIFILIARNELLGKHSSEGSA